MAPARSRPRPALLAAVLLLPLAWPSPVAAEPVGDRTLLSVGHTDAMQVYMDGDRLDLRVKDDTGASTRYHDPADVLFQVLPEAETAIPGGGIWDFIGDAGDPMWMLPLTQDPNLLWPGWSTEPIAKGQFKNDKISLNLVDVSGPGDAVLWTVRNFGEPTLFASSRDGLPDAIPVGVPAHVHAFWAFTAEGAYTLTWQATGTLADGTAVTTEEVEYHWHVGELPADPDPDPDPDPTDPDLPDESDLEGRLVLDEGHVDVLSVDDTENGLDLRAKDGTRLHGPADVYRDPDDVAFHAAPESEIVLGDQFANPGYDQVGAPGETRWHLPDTQKDGVLFAGWDTAEIPTGVLADDAVDLTLTGFSGPGELVMLTVDDFGDASVKVDTADALPQSIATSARTHAHANWFFSEPGVYRLTWQARAEATDGTTLSSPPRDYLFVVGERPDGGDPDPDPVLENTQTITAELDTDTGGLVLSVDPADRTVTLPAMTLSPDATRWSTAGDLRPVTVTDTRSADPGWNATAQVSAFVSGEDQLPGSHLGWLPTLTSKGAEQTVNPGPAVEGLLDGGPGLATSQLLASAASGAGTGTAVLQADLFLDLPTDVESGTYTALVTFTAI
ncbi:choice-of-anchor M domain-containing protein [Glycomyces harbinensis]|uniref:Surface-anchored protein n=1 Tax=Glycomyces harbinensis TaxID=58114 RepID=A0A1G7AMZ0_9ACTN|nr:choice-of-anchor M domain-containing protein [Glycomyces harbinensis]SDE16133.1 surface-anchored protein [Glycomyces harbinensis]